MTTFTVFEDKIDAELSYFRDGGGPPKGGPKTKLTTQERSVLKAFLRGKRNKEIAIDAGVRPQSVGSALCRIRQSLGVRTNVHLILLCYDKGYINVDSQ